MIDTSGHHLVYGVLTDFLTGKELQDTDDERIRQQLARMMVEEKGFARDELEPRLTIETSFNNIDVTSTIELTVRVHDKRLFLLRYGPGSLVTREKSAIAAARVLDPDYRIPLAVVTNGRDAELLETLGGQVLATGMKNIPDRTQAEKLYQEYEFQPLNNPKQKEQALRVLNVFDLEVCCRGSSCSLPDNETGE